MYFVASEFYFKEICAHNSLYYLVFCRDMSSYISDGGKMVVHMIVMSKMETASTMVSICAP